MACQLLVSHIDNFGPGGMPRWQATCSCGWAGLLRSESNADADAREHSLSDLRAQVVALTKERDEARREVAMRTVTPCDEAAADLHAKLAALTSRAEKAEARVAELEGLLRRCLPSVQFASLLPLADEINRALGEALAILERKP